MKKSALRAVTLTLVILLFTLMGCGNTNTTPVEPDVNENYVPYDEALREDDSRGLSAADYSVMNVVGTDDFGRTILSVDSKKDQDRYVGMFFFLTLGQHTNHSGIYDVDLITEQGTHNEYFTESNDMYSPVGAAHFWGEPVWGYYNSKDPWVIRKQIEMLTMSAIDFIVLDTSNNVLYKQVTDVLFPILLEYQQAGWNVPRVVYYLGKHELAGDLSAIKEAYDNFYGVTAWQSLWFTPNDDAKPMIIAPDTVIRHLSASADADERKLSELFDFRYTQWPIDPPVNEPYFEDGAPWIDFSLPQTSHNGWISLSIAQHTNVKMSETSGARGRGWTPTRQIMGVWYGQNDSENWRQGPNFEAQWKTVLDMDEQQKKQDARFVFLTGWNEWVAEKIDCKDGTYMMCDTFNAEFSRDIEPSRSSGMKDNFFLQTVRNIHADNFNAAKHYRYPQATPDITRDDADVWGGVKATYRDFTGECVARDFAAMAGVERYTDNTNRNDIDTVSVAHDEQYLYFRVSCVDDITAYAANDTSWMNIWLRTANGAGSMLNGYNYVINRGVSGGKTEIMRCKSASDMKSVGQGDVAVCGNVMIVRVPLQTLNLSAGNYSFEFKVTDNVTNPEKDLLNLYCTGDAAPIGRLNFSYGY